MAGRQVAAPKVSMRKESVGVTENKESKKAKNDIIFIGALVLILAIVVVATLVFRKEGSSVEVTVNGKLYGKYSLAVDRTIEIRSGENGENYNILVIENGKAYVSDANCPGLDNYVFKCTNQRPIQHVGRSIACNEHGVVVSISGDYQEGGGPDVES